jgi:hypothetical protein
MDFSFSIVRLVLLCASAIKKFEIAHFFSGVFPLEPLGSGRKRRRRLSHEKSLASTDPLPADVPSGASRQVPADT